MFSIIAIFGRRVLRVFLLIKYLLVFSIAFCFALRVLGQDNAAGSRKNNLQVPPLFLLSLIDKDKGAAVSLRYERLLSNKWSAAISGGYHKGAGGGRYAPPDWRLTFKRGFSIRPSLVYYLRNKAKADRAFRGFYTGGALTYSQDTFRYTSILNGQSEHKTQYFALAGGLIGYQQVVKKRISVGIEVSGGSGYTVNRQAYYGLTNRRGFGYFYFDATLRAGYIF
jgi:hypothetical protein